MRLLVWIVHLLMLLQGHIHLAQAARLKDCCSCRDAATAASGTCCKCPAPPPPPASSSKMKPAKKPKKAKSPPPVSGAVPKPASPTPASPTPARTPSPSPSSPPPPERTPSPSSLQPPSPSPLRPPPTSPPSPSPQRPSRAPPLPPSPQPPSSPPPLSCPAGQQLCRGSKYITRDVNGPTELVQTCCGGGCCGGICCPVTWKVLAVVLPHVDAMLANPPETQQPTRRHIVMSFDVMTTVKTFVAQQLPAWLSRVSSGRLQATVDVEMDTGAVTSLFPMMSQYPFPSMTDGLVVAAARNRTYDMIITIFPSHLDASTFAAAQQKMEGWNQLRLDNWVHVVGMCCGGGGFPSSGSSGTLIQPAYVSVGVGDLSYQPIQVGSASVGVGDMSYLPNQLAGLKHAFLRAIAEFYRHQPIGSFLPGLDDSGNFGYRYDTRESWYAAFATGYVWKAKAGGRYGNQYDVFGLNPAILGFGTPSKPYLPWDSLISTTIDSWGAQVLSATAAASPAQRLAAIIAAAPQQPLPTAPAVIKSQQGFAYEAFSFLATWDDAEQFCRQVRGGHLVSVVSKDEAELVQQWSSSNNISSFWLGLRCITPTGRLLSRSVADGTYDPFSGSSPYYEPCSEDNVVWTDGTPYTSSARGGYANWNGGIYYFSSDLPSSMLSSYGSFIPS